MRILLVWPNAEMSIYDVATGIRAGLEAEGHEIIDYRLYRRFKLMAEGFMACAPAGSGQPDVEMLCEHASEALAQMAILEHPDWVFVVCGMGLHPNALLAINRIGIPVAVWFTEAPYSSDQNAELYLTQFCDVAFVNERTVVSDFQIALDRYKRGGVAHYLAHAYNPDVHKPEQPQEHYDPKLDCDVVLVGTGFAERQYMLESVDWTGIDFRLIGIWPGITEPSSLCQYLQYSTCYAANVPNGLTAQMYRQAKIVLNPFRTAIGAESANPRTFEAAACGAFQISDYRREIEEIFGSSIPTYSTGLWWQLGALVRRYLADDAARHACATEALRRVKPHTFQARARSVVEVLAQHRVRRRGLTIVQSERGVAVS